MLNISSEPHYLITNIGTGSISYSLRTPKENQNKTHCPHPWNTEQTLSHFNYTSIGHYTHSSQLAQRSRGKRKRQPAARRRSGENNREPSEPRKRSATTRLATEAARCRGVGWRARARARSRKSAARGKGRRPSARRGKRAPAEIYDRR